MKKALALIAAAALMAAAGTAMAAPASIVNSKHNLSVTGTGSNITAVSSQICIYCHTPHNANGQLPLWNRNAPTQAANFVLYSGNGMTNVSNKTFTNDSISLFCMSCHDGSALGRDMLYNIPNSLPSGENLNVGGLAANVKTNLYGYAQAKATAENGGVAVDAKARSLKGTHPVNFYVDETKNTTATFGAGSGGDLASVVVSGTGFGLQSANNTGLIYPLYKSTRSTEGKTFECSSCHAVHNDEFSPFLRDSIGASKLCLGCHKK
jgi:predicted CXXCH cytochrome family protein